MLNEENHTVLQKKLTAIPLREESIIENSIRYFQDPEPCMIHRSAVMKKIYVEIQECFSAWLDGQPIAWEDIPDHIASYLQVQENVKYIQIKSI